MDEFVTLLLPIGAFDYPISNGIHSYYPYRLDLASQDEREFGGPWAVDVPVHVAPHFIHNGGFVLMSESDQSSPAVGTVRMRHRQGLGSGVSWRGEHYEADADGVVTVPHAASDELMSHQMEMVPDEAKETGAAEVSDKAAQAEAPARRRAKE
jgi:hypothetical protein